MLNDGLLNMMLNNNPLLFKNKVAYLARNQVNGEPRFHPARKEKISWLTFISGNVLPYSSQPFLLRI